MFKKILKTLLAGAAGAALQTAATVVTSTDGAIFSGSSWKQAAIAAGVAALAYVTKSPFFGGDSATPTQTTQASTKDAPSDRRLFSR